MVTVIFLCNDRFALILKGWSKTKHNSNRVCVIVVLLEFSNVYQQHIGYGCFSCVTVVLLEFWTVDQQKHWLRLFSCINLVLLEFLRVYTNTILVTVVILRDSPFSLNFVSLIKNTLVTIVFLAELLFFLNSYTFTNDALVAVVFLRNNSFIFILKR